MLVLHSISGPSSPDAGTTVDGDGEDPGISGLLGMLGSVPDPRDPRGKRHALAFVLVVCVVATLAGAKNYREIAGNAADMPRPLLKKLGAKWDWFNFRYSYPSMQTIRNVLTGIDAAGLDRITCAWLFAGQERRGRRVGNRARRQGNARRVD